MSYFVEVDDFKTYGSEEEDFHFIYNGNSGGGQSFLGGRYRDEGGNLVAPISLNGRIGVFRFSVGDRDRQYSVLLDDDSVCYEIKPRADGDSNMKLSVGDKPTPSVMIATFLMLPKPCGVKRTSDINTSVLNGNNFWLQSMWLSVDATLPGKAILTPKDCVICGGIDRSGQGDARYFRIDFHQRIFDIIKAADDNDLDEEVRISVKHFADIYRGVKPFVYDESAEVVKMVMKYLSSRYPERYSGTLDPLSIIKDLAHLGESCRMDGSARLDVLAAIRTKPFVLLAGISGTGKSRLVRQLARGCCPANSPLKDEQKPGNFEIIPVKPNWHDSTELMGFVTRITEDNKPKYVLTPFVKFLAKAWMNPDVPFFLCLDEMNLAPVEQYFAEYLSAIESRKWVDASDPTKGIKTDVVVKFGAEKSNGTVDPFVEETVKRLLPDYETAADGTPVKMLGDAMCEAGGIRIPSNLVVMGTVNMDETTCSFSRKVLDRAMTFELNDVSNMYTIDEINAEGDVPFGSIDAELARCSLLGAKDAVNSDAGKVEVDSATHDTVAKRILDYIKTVNEKLENTPFKIAYRSRDEIMVYCLERIKGGIVKLPTALDEATSMKILSRIEGDDQKLTIQVDDGHGGKKAANLLDELEKTIKGALKVANGGSDPNPECSVCSGKLEFMKGRLEAGFTNFFV